MKNWKPYLSLIILSFIAVTFISVIAKDNKSSGINKTSTNDDYEYIAINECKMYMGNNGDGSHNPVTDGSGFYWPGGENTTLSPFFEDGLIWGGIIDTQIHVGGNTYRSGLQAGKILPGGIADNPNDPRYRVYKIRKDWQSLPVHQRASYQLDYEQWPWQDGAPFIDTDGDGIYTPYVDAPEYLGDEMLWFVANDLDTNRTTYIYGSVPMGLEMQCTVFAFNRNNELGDMVFKKYKLINKGVNTIKEMYLGLWSDPDLGDAGDDYVGCDTLLNIGYVYNSDNNDDGYYGQDPPAAGYVFLQGPIVESIGDSAKFNNSYVNNFKNLKMTSFLNILKGSPAWQDADLGYSNGAIQTYYHLMMRGLNGEYLIDLDTGDTLQYMVPGDPWQDIGWHQGAQGYSFPMWGPGDRRFIMSSGSFTMAPGDTQEITIGIVIARAPGEGNLAAVRELKRKTRLVQQLYNNDFQITPKLPQPEIQVATSDGRIQLYWNDNVEDYDVIDPITTLRGLDDTTYTFEGYRIWQFSGKDGENPILLNTSDLVNDVDIIYEIQQQNGVNVNVPVIHGPNKGSLYQLLVTEDAYFDTPLKNGTTYYFGISAYAYSANSCPTYLESPLNIIVVSPGTLAIDVSYPYESGEFIQPKQLSGYGDGGGYLFVVDPEELSGNKYLMTLDGPADSLIYDVLEINGEDTTVVIAAGSFFGMDLSKQPIIDGFQFVAINQGADSIAALWGDYGVRSIMEIKGPNGAELEEPISVDNNFNSTNKWKMVGLETEAVDQELNWCDRIGYDNYEIRFTAEGSKYYLSGYDKWGFPSSAPFKDDPKAANKLPFEVWSIGKEVDSTEDDIRLVLKILDSHRFDSTAAKLDSVYTKLENGNWEQVYAYFMDSTYADVLPDRSGGSVSANHKLGKIIFTGSNLPAEGTVIRVTTWRPLSADDSFELVATQANLNDLAGAKSQLDKISVFPNPYFPMLAVNSIGESQYDKFMRFTNLPKNVTIRIFTLAGTLVKRIEKQDDSQWLDWDLQNMHGRAVGSGIYIVHLEMPGVGTKTMKLAIIQGK